MTRCRFSMETSVHKSMPFPDYLGVPHLSTSGMKTLLKSPLKYLWEKTHREDKEAWRVGRVLHTVCLEPQEFESRYAIRPDKRTKAGKAEALEIEEAGLECISEKDWNTALGVQEALKNHITIRDGKEFPLLAVLAGCEFEQSFFWEDPDTGIPLKARTDAVNHDMRYIVDLKFVQDASPDGFAKAVANYGYTLQHVVYSRGVAQCMGFPQPYRFIFLAIEKTPPYDFGLYEISEEDVQAIGAQKFDEALERYKKIENTPTWAKQSHTKGIMKLALPQWVYYERKEQ